MQSFVVSYLAGPEDVAEEVIGAEHEEGEDRRLHEEQGLVDGAKKGRLQQHPNFLRSNSIEKCENRPKQSQVTKGNMKRTHVEYSALVPVAFKPLDVYAHTMFIVQCVQVVLHDSAPMSSALHHSGAFSDA